MAKASLIKALEQLSLTRNEALVYLELLQLGASNAGPIIRKVELHRQLVYAALSRLEDAGLVAVTLFNNRKVFQAAPTENLVALQAEREKIARALVPQLTALEPQNQDRLAVQTVSGRQEFFKAVISSLEVAARNDGIIRVIGGASSQAFYDTLGDYYDQYVQACDKLRITKHLITSSLTAEHFKKRFANEKRTVLKLVDEGLSSPTYTRITPELVALEIYGAQPTVIQIWNRAIASGYLEHFELLWKKAKRYR